MAWLGITEFKTMKIKEYKLIGSRVDYNDDKTDLSAIGNMKKSQFSEIISTMILEGWQPFGCISFDNSPRYPEAFQAMVKYDESTGWTQPYLINPTQKERKVIDCFASEFFSSSVADGIEKSTLELNDNWETIFKKEGKLKMVKYE